MDFSLFEPRQDAVLVFAACRISWAAGFCPICCWSVALSTSGSSSRMFSSCRGGSVLWQPVHRKRAQDQAGGFSAVRWPAASAAATIAAASGVMFLGSVNVEEPPPA